MAKDSNHLVRVVDDFDSDIVDPAASKIIRKGGIHFTLGKSRNSPKMQGVRDKVRFMIISS